MKKRIVVSVIVALFSILLVVIACVQKEVWIKISPSDKSSWSKIYIMGLSDDCHCGVAVKKDGELVLVGADENWNGKRAYHFVSITNDGDAKDETWEVIDTGLNPVWIGINGGGYRVFSVKCLPKVKNLPDDNIKKKIYGYDGADDK